MGRAARGEGMEELLDHDVLGPLAAFSYHRRGGGTLSELLGTFFMLVVACGGGVMSHAFRNTNSRTAVVTDPVDRSV